MIGVHIGSSTLDEFMSNIEKAHMSGFNAIQIMDPKINEKYYDTIKDTLQIKNMIMFVHAQYTINIAKDWDKHDPHIFSFISEIERAHMMGAVGLVVHLGKQMDLTLDEAYNNMFTTLIYVHNQTLQYEDVKILLETTAGQGTELCSTMDGLAYFYRKIPKDIRRRIKICIDTCHLFVAGYDLRTRENIRLFLDTFEEMIGINYVGLVHLNDSMAELGSNRDRHAIINGGNIGGHALRLITKFFTSKNIPVILETPSDDYTNDIKLIS